MAGERDENMEQSILAAAERLFMERGFALTSTTDIAKAVGCNQALIHYYFRTKDRLFETVFEQKATLFFSTVLAIENTNRSFEEELKLKVEAHFDLLKKNPRLPFLLLNEIATNPGRLLSLKAKIGNILGEIFARLDSRLREEIDKGTIKPVHVVDLIFDIVSLNVSVFLARPILDVALGITEEDYESMLERRKKENVEIILNTLKKPMDRIP